MQVLANYSEYLASLLRQRILIVTMIELLHTNSRFKQTIAVDHSFGGRLCTSYHCCCDSDWHGTSMLQEIQ